MAFSLCMPALAIGMQAQAPTGHATWWQVGVQGAGAMLNGRTPPVRETGATQESTRRLNVLAGEDRVASSETMSLSKEGAEWFRNLSHLSPMGNREPSQRLQSCGRKRPRLPVPHQHSPNSFLLQKSASCGLEHLCGPRIGFHCKNRWPSHGGLCRNCSQYARPW